MQERVCIGTRYREFDAQGYLKGAGTTVGRFSGNDNQRPELSRDDDQDYPNDLYFVCRVKIILVAKKK